MKRIMYVENKASGEAWIGMVSFSRTRKTLYYKNKIFVRISGVSGNYAGYTKEDYDKGNMSNYDEYWISGPKKNGCDMLYDNVKINVDEDVWNEYWVNIRNKPEMMI